MIKTKIFEDILVSMENFNQSNATVQHWMECYNVTGGPDDDGSLNINIIESEGTHAVEGFSISSDQFLKSLKF